jgi:hypothetical protein
MFPLLPASSLGHSIMRVSRMDKSSSKERSQKKTHSKKKKAKKSLNIVENND